MADGRGQRAEGSTQMDGRGQRADGRGQMADGRGQRADGGFPRAEGPSDSGLLPSALSSLPSDGPLPSAVCHLPSRNKLPFRTVSGQEGFTLAALVVIMTILSIVVAYTVPEQWSMIMKRERERQTIHLMKQYARGIRAFQKKHKALPTSLKQLQEAKNPRLIRGGGKWACPLTGGEEDWIMVPPGAVGGSAQGAGAGGKGKGGRGQGRAKGGQGGLKPPSDLNPEASPADYAGPFVGVRPKASGKSFIALNGAEDYGEWVYTVQDLENEITMRQMGLAAK